MYIKLIDNHISVYLHFIVGSYCFYCAKVPYSTDNWRCCYSLLQPAEINLENVGVEKKNM